MTVSATTLSYISKFPVDKKGKHILPCISLIPENMQDWMVGLRVSIGLSDPATASSQGYIVSWDEEKLTIEVGGKKKKLPYHPIDIQLCVHQFDIGVVFNGLDREHSAGMEVPITASPEVVLRDESKDQNNDCEEHEETVELVKETIPVVPVDVPNTSTYKPRNSIKRN